MSQNTVTFVGLGAIGFPMAQRALAAGFDVSPVDPAPAARVRAEEAGFTAVAAFSEAPEASVVVVMVATPEQLDGLVGDAVASGALAGKLWVIMSTVGRESVRSAEAALASAGALVVDAPVTGGVARAATGELVIFAAGDAATLGRVRSVLDAFGAVKVVGATVGDGQAVKVINQHLCSVHLAAAGEALALAGRLGLDPAAVLELVAGGAAGSWMLSDRGPRMVAPNEAVTSTIGIFVKDSGLVEQAAAETGAEVPILQAARARFLKAADAGLDRADDSRVIDTYGVV